MPSVMKGNVQTQKGELKAEIKSSGQFNGKMSSNGVVRGAVRLGGGGGTLNHAELLNRDKPNQHPISAIEGLEQALHDVTNAPYIGENLNWFVWDRESEQYVDSGVRAFGSGGYYGTEAPADPGIVLWIDPSGDGLIDASEVKY